MKRVLIISTAIIGICMGLLFFYYFNPTETKFALRCPFKLMTGWSCAGCGMQRFLHALMHGRFMEAISYNYILLILIPYTILFGLERLILKGNIQKQCQSVVEGHIATVILCAIAPIWMVIRNMFNI